MRLRLYAHLLLFSSFHGGIQTASCCILLCKKNYVKTLNIWAKLILGFQVTVKLYLFFPLSEVKNINGCKLKMQTSWVQVFLGRKPCGPSFESIHSQCLRLGRPFLQICTFNLMFLIQFSSLLVAPMFIISWEDPSRKAVMYAVYFITYKHGGLGVCVCVCWPPFQLLWQWKQQEYRWENVLKKTFYLTSLCQHMGKWLFANISLLP